MKLRRAVFLDRDGVLVKSGIREGQPVAPASLEQFQILPGVPAALEQLKRRGFLLVVVTNQPDVARGVIPAAAIEQMHRRLLEVLPVDDIRVCMHDDGDGCHCRKPKPGMILDAARAYGIDLRGSFMVGDRWRDVEAGHAAGCKTVFIEHGYGERQPAVPPDARVHSLEEAVDWILAHSREES